MVLQASEFSNCIDTENPENLGLPATGVCVIVESVDSVSRDGMETPIYIIHDKHPNISKQVIL